MEAVLDLSPEEARTYSMILDAASTLPKSDPRFALTLTFTWWLLHRRRRLEQQRVRRRQFYRRLRRLIFLRWHIQRNSMNGAMAMASGGTPRGSGLKQQLRKEKLSAVVPEKRLWVRQDRTEDFWTKVDQNLISDEQFRKCFHMSKETFDYVYDELAEQLQKSNTTMRDSLPGKKRLAATIYRMATNAEYIRVASLFGIGKSTTTSLVRDVCEVIVANLKDKFLTFIGEGHNPEDMKRKVDEAAEKFGLDKVVGVLGSTDVLIIGSSWDWSESSPYISSYHKNYAVTFQAVVDADGTFSHVSAGSPSSLTNKQILEECGLKKEFMEKFGSDAGLAARIVADESYSEGGEEQGEWILTQDNYQADGDNNEKQLMQEKISQARQIFDDAVLRVKSRWKIFHGKNGKINFSADAFEKIALACCILHNICELQEDEVESSWGSDIGPEVYSRRGHPKAAPSITEGDITVTVVKGEREGDAEEQDVMDMLDLEEEGEGEDEDLGEGVEDMLLEEEGELEDEEIEMEGTIGEGEEDQYQEGAIEGEGEEGQYQQGENEEGEGEEDQYQQGGNEVEGDEGDYLEGLEGGNEEGDNDEGQYRMGENEQEEGNGNDEEGQLVMSFE